jgi:MFS family permease
MYVGGKTRCNVRPSWDFCGSKGVVRVRRKADTGVDQQSAPRLLYSNYSLRTGQNAVQAGLASTSAAAMAAAPITTRFPLLAPLSERNYRLLWLGNAVSQAGDQFQMVALAVLALQLTQSATVLGTVLMVQAVPRVLFMLAGGVVVDRFQPRRVMLTSNLLQGLLVAAVVIALGLRRLELWHMYAYALGSGMVFAFSIPAAQSLVPQLVSRERLRSANALSSLSMNFAMFLYPPIAGLLVAAAGTLPAFAVNAATFLVASLVISWIRQPESSAFTAALGGPLRRLLESIAAARQDRVIWVAILSATAFSLGYGGAMQVGLPAFAQLTLEAGASGIGILFGANGAGAVLGAAFMGTVAQIRRQGLFGALALLGLGLAVMLIATAPSLLIAVPIMALAGTVRAALANLYITLVQSRAPAEMRGRIMALFMMGVMGLAPFSLGAGGLLADLLGPRALIAAGGSVVALAGVYALTQKPFRDAE